jgi:hypothetical protein
MDYKKIYDQFIADRRLKEPECYRGKSKNQRIRIGAWATGRYFEHHHVIPTSMGGKNIASNFISITAEDHFFAHLLLAYAYGGKQWRGVEAMGDLPGSTKSRKLHGQRKWVAIARSRAAVVRSEHTKRQHAQGELYAHCHSDASKAKRSATMKANFKNNPELGLTLRRNSQSPEAKEKKSIAQNKLWTCDEYRDKHLKNNAFCNGINPMHDPEVRKVISIFMTEYCSSAEVKEKRSKAISGDKNPSKRPEVALMISQRLKVRYLEDPLSFAKKPILYNGELMSTRKACQAIGVLDNAIFKKAKRKGWEIQYTFDWYLTKTPAERRHDALLQTHGIEFNGELLLKKDICKKYAIKYSTIIKRSKANNTSWIDEAYAAVAVKKAA